MGIDFTRIFTEEVLQFAKTISIVFALVHFLIGFVLIRQMSRMNAIIETRIAGIIRLIGIIYLVILSAVLLLLILA